MIKVSVRQAKIKLGYLLKRVDHGEVVIILRDGVPIAKIAPCRTERKLRKPGSLKGKITISPDFDRLPAKLKHAFGMQ